MTERKSNFRTDINGLRAIAVIAVVIYHFAAQWLPGGFSGVDVFFVISGFLMTSIVFTKLEVNHFSILEFYWARAKRIIPPLVALCLVLFIFAWFILPPLYFEGASKHITASLGFISNIIYLRESGYFDTSSHEKWLLHTWSLSVEWQFYLIFPLVILGLAKLFGVAKLKYIVLAGTLFGFIFNLILVEQSLNSSFYLLGARAWEMLLGGLAFLFPFKFKRHKYIQALGIAIIILGYLLLSSDMHWPGYFSLVPVLGTYLILVSNYGDSFLSRNRFMQVVGRSSYSIYLWHWPVAVFFYLLDVELTLISLLVGITLSLLIGYLAYYLVELKYCTKSSNHSINYARHAVTSAFFFSLLSMTSYIYINGDYVDRVDASVTKKIDFSPKREQCNVLKGKYKDPDTSCEFFYRDASWATMGDSHSIELAYAMALTLDDDKSGVKQFSASACPPLYDFKLPISEEYRNCKRWTNDAVSEIVSDEVIKNVLISYRMSSVLFGDNIATYPELPNDEPMFIDDFEADKKRSLLFNAYVGLINHIATTKENVYVVLPIPELSENINKQYFRHIFTHSFALPLGNIPATKASYYQKRHAFFLGQLSHVKFQDNVHFVDPSDSFCDLENCFSFMSGEPLYFDDDHLSVAGSLYITKEVLKKHRALSSTIVNN